MFFSLLFMFEIVKRGRRTYRHIVNCWSHCNWWQFAHWQEKGKDPQDLIFMTTHFFPFLNCRPQDSLGVTSALHFLNVLLSIFLCSEGYVKLEILVSTPEIARWLIFLKSFCAAHWIADTIPGRQCMASCFVVLKQVPDAMVYLNSIKVAEWSEMMSHLFYLITFHVSDWITILSHWYCLIYQTSNNKKYKTISGQCAGILQENG